MHVSIVSAVSWFVHTTFLYWVSKNDCATFERLLFPEYISNDILQYLIEWQICSSKFRNFRGQNGSLRPDSVSDFLK